MPRDRSGALARTKPLVELGDLTSANENEGPDLSIRAFHRTTPKLGTSYGMVSLTVVVCWTPPPEPFTVMV